MQGLALRAVQHEDAALGAAWRRCEAALPEGWVLELDGGGPPYVAWCFDTHDSNNGDEAEAATATEALTTLAETLERAL